MMLPPDDYAKEGVFYYDYGRARVDMYAKIMDTVDKMKVSEIMKKEDN